MSSKPRLSVESLKAAERGTSEVPVDFILQKRRVDEAFEELLHDLAAFRRVKLYLQADGKGNISKWKELSEQLSVGHDYASFRQGLKDLDEQATAKPTLESANNDQHPTISFLQDITERVQAIATKSLLRPESPPVRIKNRSEQESLEWARLIRRQEAEIDALNRQLADWEQKIADRKDQRCKLQVRSDREMDEQLYTSQVQLVELRIAGDGRIQRLQSELSNEPDYRTMPTYLTNRDQVDQDRKRITRLLVQLELWIKKYDKLIGEPMVELEELEQRVAGLEEWYDSVLVPQTELLRDLQEQVDAYEEAALEERIAQMKKVHAVRVLQRAWKRTLEGKRSKRAKKGAKKGKKAK
ncbi:dynein regulatory complex protein 10-like [Anopheles aquasalis]|uniref:dynein regulatory complex protein 10-like n=1 Tax=Anopheles aquasalis TaxID=42839 RepID=UPI00215A5BD1|nr:dynein regulatory complex protein 10-like [Anopheles aquasalis]